MSFQDILDSETTAGDLNLITPIYKMFLADHSSKSYIKSDCLFNHSHKKQIVWKDEPNWSFYVFMLTTKLYYNPFFFTGHQNVNNSKSRAARTVYGLIFLPFYKIIVSIFSFLCQDANKTRSLYVLVMSRTRFRVNPLSIVASLAK